LITFRKDKMQFTYRIVGIVINDAKVLLHRGEEDDFWSFPGGRCELLENSKETLKREMQEELKIDIKVERLLWVVENFFEYNGIEVHELGLYFLMSFPNDCYIYEKGESFIGYEEECKLIFQWFPIDNFENIELYPSFLRKALKSIPENIEHIIHTDIK